MNPQVTIGVCVKNNERSIKEAIESIIAQDFPHDRIRVVFVDESEDGTLAIIQDYVQKMDMTTLVIHMKGKGLGYARNVVIANAEGDYIFWVDADMIISPIFLGKLVDFMEKNPKAGIVKGKQALLPAHNLLGTLEAYSRAAGRMVDYQSKIGQFKVVGTGGALFRLEAIRQVGGFDDKLKGYNEDWDLELRMRRAGWTFHLEDIYFYDYERFGLTWKSLWRRYWRRGYYTSYFLHKNKGMIKHYRMFPPAAVLAGLLSSFRLFKLTQQRIVFLLPLQYAFKMTAWYIGFIEGHTKSRDHKSSESQSFNTHNRILPISNKNSGINFHILKKSLKD